MSNNSRRLVPANNTNPRVKAFISRIRVPLLNNSFTEFDPVDTTKTWTSNSMATQRPAIAAPSSTVFVGGITTTGAEIYYTTVDKIGRRNGIWELYTSIAGAKDLALAFIGDYVTVLDRVEFITTGDLIIFFINAADELIMRKDQVDTVVGNNVLSCDAIMGIKSQDGSISQGLLIAWVTTAGIAFTRQYDDETGSFETAAQVDTAPEDLVKIKIERTWDYRAVLTVEDTDGAIYQIKSRSVALGMANREMVAPGDITTDIQAGFIADVLGYGSESIAPGDITTDIRSGYVDGPALAAAFNYDNGSGNYGLMIETTFDEDISDTVSIIGWLLTDNNSNTFACGSVEKKPGYDNILLLRFADFNGYTNPFIITYDGTGDITNYDGSIAAPASVTSFNATGLVTPNSPVADSGAVIDNTNIEITFITEDLTSIGDLAAAIAAFTITCNEPAYTPGGGNVLTTYEVSNVAISSGDPKVLEITLSTAGRIKYPLEDVTVAYDGTGLIVGANGSVRAFNISADITGATLVLYANINDPENIAPGDIITDIAAGQIVPQERQNDDQAAIAPGDITTDITAGYTEDIPT